jgi:hypothetical protein
MSKMAEIAYDIEQLFIDGLSDKNIAKTLSIPLEMVHDWMESNGIAGFARTEDAVDERGVYVGLSW